MIWSKICWSRSEDLRTCFACTCKDYVADIHSPTRVVLSLYSLYWPCPEPRSRSLQSLRTRPVRPDPYGSIASAAPGSLWIYCLGSGLGGGPKCWLIPICGSHLAGRRCVETSWSPEEKTCIDMHLTGHPWALQMVSFRAQWTNVGLGWLLCL